MIEYMTDHWQIITIVILCIDKAVALSPTDWDDMLWTSIKKVIYKLVGKK